MTPKTTQGIKYYEEQLPNGVIIELIYIPGGSFDMGSNDYEDEQPIHRVNVASFYLGKYLITNQQYLSFVEATGRHHPEWMEEGNRYNIYTGTNDGYKSIGQSLTAVNYPVVGVSWTDATVFCEWLSIISGKSFRLPSESEWEYAAKGGQNNCEFRYAGSNKFKEVGWYSENSHGSTKAVGMKWPNKLGLCDMNGNIWEWCADHWHDNYEASPEDGSAWTTGGAKNDRVVRGGSWYEDDYYCTVSGRARSSSTVRSDNIGFRIVRD